jgi:phospholipase/lecithinase/hemolysin
LFFVTGQIGLQVEAGHRINHPSKKLFVFGDSYADTGNTKKSKPGSWKEPYGITSPGKPTGRFSDGRVLTDFIGTLSNSLSLILIVLLIVINWNTTKWYVV